MRWRRARRTAYYQRLGEDFLRRMDWHVDGRCAAIKACHDGPDAMAALLDDLGKRIAAERARHGFPEPTPTMAQHPSENHRPPLGASHV